MQIGKPDVGNRLSSLTGRFEKSASWVTMPTTRLPRSNKAWQHCLPVSEAPKNSIRLPAGALHG